MSALSLTFANICTAEVAVNWACEASKDIAADNIVDSVGESESLLSRIRLLCREVYIADVMQ